jgi:hypothetical protein
MFSTQSSNLHSTHDLKRLTCVVCSSKCLSITSICDAKATAVGEAKKGGGGGNSEDDWEDMDEE